ncbi:RluA family pseudouridine synthase [Candidatus Saccharibacteria bacterium]|nr:RluA family pseudouridine synthase [Candidatus Saccharibacteria bacterium]
MAKKFSKPELSRMINGDIPFDTVISDTDENLSRLDVEVLNQNPRYSRATIQKFIKAGYVAVDGNVILKPNFLISDESEIILTVPASEQAEKPPVIYEDDNVIVFNKPAGMLSIKKGDFSTEPAIEDFGHIVHRLDRDTSGVIIVAKNLSTKGFLQKQFQERKSHKTYYAVVCGSPAQAHAIINIPLARNLKKPTTFMPDKNGREAITEYQTLESGEKFSLVELKPRTGRTHQLRIHMNFIHCPILGDPVYNPKGPKADRMYLHAAVLEITIPGKDGGQRLTFTAELPEEFKNAIK